MKKIGKIVKDKGGEEEEEESVQTDMFFTDLNAYQNCVRAQREGCCQIKKSKHACLSLFHK